MSKNESQVSASIKPSNLKAYRIIVAVLTIGLVLVSGFAAYLYFVQVPGVNNDLSLRNAQVASMNSQIGTYKSQIDSLQAQINSLNSQASTQQATIASLQAQISLLQAANLIGTFGFSSSCSPSCNYAIDSGAYANTGTHTANSASVTFSFRSGSQGAGMPLCTTTAPLGAVMGQTVTIFATPATAWMCEGSSSTPATSITYTFSWS